MSGLVVDTVLLQPPGANGNREFYEAVQQLTLIVTEVQTHFYVFGDALVALFAAGMADARTIATQAMQHNVVIQTGLLARTISLLAEQAIEHHLTELPDGEVVVIPSILISRLQSVAQLPTSFASGGVVVSAQTERWCWLTARLAGDPSHAVVTSAAPVANGQIPLLWFPEKYAHRLRPEIIFAENDIDVLNRHFASITQGLSPRFQVEASEAFIQSIEDRPEFLADPVGTAALLALIETLSREGQSPQHDTRAIRSGEGANEPQVVNAAGCKAFRATLRSDRIGWRISYWLDGTNHRIELQQVLRKQDSVTI